MFLTFLAKYWKLAAFAVLALVATWLWVTVAHWREDSIRLPQVEAKAEKDLADAARKIEHLQLAYENAYHASEGYQRELKTLHDAAIAAGPAPVIRVCKPAKLPRPSGSQPATGPDAAATGAGVLQETLDLDTSPLFADADIGDALSAQIRGLHDFLNRQQALCQQP